MTTAVAPLLLAAVEIKISLDGDQVRDAERALRLREKEAQQRVIWFCEFLRGPGGTAALPLLDHGIILRLRQKRGDQDDTTVKLRRFGLVSERPRSSTAATPERASEQAAVAPLPPAWQHAAHGKRWTFGIEGDWAGERQQVSASLVTTWKQGLAKPTKRRVLAAAFSPRQVGFLHAVGPLPIDVSALDACGPIRALKWEPEQHAFEHPVVAERWTVDDLTFLELSMRVPAAIAVAAQDSFQTAIRRMGFAVSELQETKTRLVLEHFASR